MGKRHPLLYYITDRSQFSDDEPGRCRALFDKIAEAARAGVDYIQLREKDLSARELEELARKCVDVIECVRSEHPETNTRFLINSRIDVALAVGADGVHLRADDVSAREVRQVVQRASPAGRPQVSAPVTPSHENRVRWGPRFRACRGPRHGREPGPPVKPGPPVRFLIGVSCHTVSDVQRAEGEGTDFVVFAPVFEKRGASETTPTGLAALRSACEGSIPVLALGGVNLENARACLEAGAAGIAGIRLFQENNINDVVRSIRA